MTNYNSIHTGLEIDIAVTTINDGLINQYSYIGIIQDQELNITTVNDTQRTRLVQVYELVVGSYTKAIETDYSISLLDATTTRIKKLSAGPHDIKVNIFI